MGSRKSPYTTSYRSSIDIIALNCLIFEKIAFFAFWRQTDKQMDSVDALEALRNALYKFKTYLLTYSAPEAFFWDSVTIILTFIIIYNTKPLSLSRAAA